MIDVWTKFTKGMTNVGVRFRDEEIKEKMLPCLTACPWNAFKKPGKKFTETFAANLLKVFYICRHLGFNIFTVKLMSSEVDISLKGI